MMPDTGWRELTDNGWNSLCAPEKDSILRAASRIMVPCARPIQIYGDGSAATRIIEAVARAPFAAQGL